MTGDSRRYCKRMSPRLAKTLFLLRIGIYFLLPSGQRNIEIIRIGRQRSQATFINLRMSLPRDEDSKSEQAQLLVNRMSRRLCETETLGSGRYSTKFYSERLFPKDQPSAILYTFMKEKVPISYTFH